MTTELALADERKATWLESAMTQYPIVAPQMPMEITSKHIREKLGQPARKSDCASLFRKLQAAKLVEFARYEKSDRPERRGGATVVWRRL